MNLRSTYLGFPLANPLVPGASPMTGDLDLVRRLEDAGAPMIIMHSIFQEQLMREQVALNRGMEQADNSYAESLSYLPRPDEFRLGPDEYLNHLRRVKAAVKVPVVGSLNGRTLGGWVEFARQIQQAGADALELNIYDPILDQKADAGTVENTTFEVVRAVKQAVSIPVAVKLSPFYTSFVNFAHRLTTTGIAGLVLFNRFYQPDFDIEALEVRPTLHFSTPSELLPRLHWAAILYGHLKGDIAITGGVHSAEDVLKSIMAGGSVAMMVSALHIHGIDHIARVLADLRYWLDKREYASLAETRGCLSRKSVPDTSPYDRGNYIKTLSSYSLRQTVAAF